MSFPSTGSGTTAGSRLRAQFREPCGGEVAVEGERLLDPLGAHVGEAGRVDEGVLALVVPAQPAQGLVFELVGYVIDLNVPGLLEAVEEPDGPSVPRPRAEPGPGLATDMVRGDDPPSGYRPIEAKRRLVVLIPFDGARDQERRVDEDQGWSRDSP